MGLTLTVTNAGRSALVNAANTGTNPVTVAQVGLSGTAVTPDAAATALPGEFKRLGTLSGDVVADDTIHLIVRDETGDVFTVRSLALYLADGTLFAIYGQADVLVEKSAQALMLLEINVRFEDIDDTDITFGDANFLNPPATTEQIGVVELATLVEAVAGTDSARVPAAKMVKDAVFAWMDARFGANNAGIWHPGNDGAGSGLDADLLDGQDSGYYTNITARLGYTPVQQGTGNGQGTNTVKIGWSGSRLKATVDVTDQGNFVFDGHIADVWRASNDGAGSGLDADLLDGQDGTYYTNITARLGYTPLNKAGDTATGRVTFNTGATGNNGVATAAGNLGELEVRGNGTGAAMMTFHRPNSHAAYFGLDTDNSLKLGGWSLGAAAYKIWHSGNDGAGSGLDADLLDGQDSTYYTNITARLGYTPVSKTGDTMTEPLVVAVGSHSLTLGSDGAIEIMRSGGGPYIDFKDSNSEDYDVRIQASGSVLGVGASSLNVGGNPVWHSANDGSGSGLDADLLDGQDSSYYTNIVGRLGYTPVNKAGDTLTNVFAYQVEENSGIAARPSANTPLTVLGNGTGPAVMTFHRQNSYAMFFGVDNDNQLKFGGWSAGAVANVIWHSANDGAGSGLDADMLDGYHASAFSRLDGGTVYSGPVKATNGNQLLLKNGIGSGRTLIHRNDGATYFLLLTDAASGAPSEAWNSLRPFAIDMASGYLTSVNGQRFDGGCTVNGGLSLNGSGVWSSGNDGSGSGLDADLLDGYQGSAYERIVSENLVANGGYTVYASGKKETWGTVTIPQDSYATYNLPTAHSSWVHPTFGLSTQGGNTTIQQNTGITSINYDGSGNPVSITFWNADDRNITIWVRTKGV